MRYWSKTLHSQQQQTVWVQLQVLLSARVVVLPGVCVYVCVFNDGGFPSILMVIGGLEWSFCSGTRSPLQGSGAGLQDLQWTTIMGGVVWTTVCVFACKGGVCVCACACFWSGSKKVASSRWVKPLLLSPSCCLFRLWTRQSKYSAMERMHGWFTELCLFCVCYSRDLNWTF